MAMASGMLHCFNCTSIAGGKKHKRSSTRETVAKCATLSCQISRYVEPGVSSTFAAGLHHQLASSSQISRFVYPGVSPLFATGLHRLASSSQIHMLTNQRSREVFCQGFGDRSRADAANTLPYRNSNNKRGSLAQLELEIPQRTKKKTSFDGIFLILLINLASYAADHWFQLPAMKALYLYHRFPQWYQFITSTFCHVSWSHLSSNLFFLYIFGKLVEEEEGSFAVWLSYLVTGVGANVVSWLVLPRSVVSAGASGAVFGLFAVSVLVKLSFDWRKILEVLILGQFVVEKVMEAAHSSAQLAGHTYGAAANINHIAHLSGALVGVALIWLINQIPSLGDDSKSSISRKDQAQE
ncbi:unnamed protein product [Sphagnum troendelagicum]|uniref:Peptidase S54 rhomboid domain-containing protein n=1 Tax=Sphagnum troendelagicum TaxID=128251 RepID=A0ABP0V2B7_9BRYO